MTASGRPPLFSLGGNCLSTAPPGPVRDFVEKHGGHTVITKILIANNGIAAVKEIRSVRKWAYETFGDEHAIQFTVMATPEDLKVNAEYIRMADQYIEVPGGSNNNNYANVALITEIAERTGVHAVWAGWGHASENPRLPERLAQSRNKIVFIGPPGSAMRSLGDKISSTIVAQSADVSTMGWSGSGITETVADEHGHVAVPATVYERACVRDVEDGLVKAKQIGFPVMIKASEGGGGKGIRKVENAENFKQAFAQVQGEVPGSPVFIMQLVGDARHLEVQLLADQYGNAISLFGRDCSVQRRHQKIIEEAPATIAKPETFEAMEKAAVRLAKLVGYVSAGTVEYLYSHERDYFCFLELNPRLQVEHPTTEMVSGVNLPAAQLQIAMGIPLHRIRDIRVLYGLAPNGTSEIDFEFSNPQSLQTQRRPTPKGHVIAVRITAENPDAGFKPSSGMVHELNFRSSTNVWGYFSVNGAGGLHEFADSQFGHIFAYGENRQQSRKNMVMALKELSIRGDFRTTVEYLIKLLETQAFEENAVTTGWLDMLISDENITVERPDTMIAVTCGAVTKAHLASEESFSTYQRFLEKGQIPSKDYLRTVFAIDFIYQGVRYKFTATQSAPHSFILYLNGSRAQVSVRPLSDGGLLILLDGNSHTCYFREEVQGMRLMINGKTCLLEQENDPTQLRSPSPGKLVRFLVESGEHVNRDQPYAEMEVMKIYMTLVATEDGVVQFIKQPNATLETGDIIGILTLDDPNRVRLAQPFEGQLPLTGPPVIIGDKPHHRYREVVKTLECVLNGYDNQSVLQASVKELMELLRNPELPYLEFLSVLSTLSGRIPIKLDTALHQVAEESRKQGLELPARRLKDMIDSYALENAIHNFHGLVSPLVDVLGRFINGLKAHEWSAISHFLDMYHEVEILFSASSKREDEVVLSLREQFKDDLDKIVGIVFSHSKVGAKNNLLLALLDQIKPAGGQTIDKYFSPVLKKLTELDSGHTSKVALKARELLIQCHLPSYEERMVQMEQILRAAVIEKHYGEDGYDYRTPSYDSLKELIDTRFAVFDVLPNFFYHEDNWIRLAALEVYARRAYRAYQVLDVDYYTNQVPFFVSWDFSLHSAHSAPHTPTRVESSGMKRIVSVSDMSFMIPRTEVEPTRVGAIMSCVSHEEISENLPRILAIFPKLGEERRTRDSTERDDITNVLNIALRLDDDDVIDDEALKQKLQPLVQSYETELREHGIRRVSIMLFRKGQYPGYFTFREVSNFSEDQTIRHIEPAMAYQLELSRLSNFDIRPCFTENRQIHVYYAVGKENTSDCRFFIRALVRPGRIRNSVRTADYLISESDRLLTEILDTLELISSQHKNSDCNHLYINFIPTFVLEPREIEEALKGFLYRHGKRLWRLRVTGAEVRFKVEDPHGGGNYPLRVIIDNVSGYVVRVEAYQEIKTDRDGWILKSIDRTGSMHLQPIDSLYPTKELLQARRYKAHLMGTTYVYDFPELFSQAIRNKWTRAARYRPGLKCPSNVLNVNELVLDDKDRLQEVERDPGRNICGMVAWRMKLYTPEYPAGRQVIVIANDITYKIGSFGPDEDHLFHKATELARRLGVPRVYLAANSGARIGLAEDLMDHFSVAWVDKDNPTKGTRYIYLTPEAYKHVKQSEQQSVIVEEIVDDGERRYKILDIIGAQDGLGVECLKGSGLIAGATSRAYEDIFTITLVTCRSVGIGAYLVRLGQRTIQNEGQPIILTGAPALNKVLGREVYTSNLQLGGTQIMFKNGVSHLTAQNDLEGITKIVLWLSYVPASRGMPVPIVPNSDDWDRDIGYEPPKGSYDPRWLIAGKYDVEGDPDSWRSGFFDRDSFVETLSGWARTVVVGRARLGGIPMGVIAVETRTVEHVIPADPANADSHEQLITEAGQVWYPNSAYKTAQAIRDFNNGEQLPLMIFANWRGFSGGQRDMFDEVLKYGSNIVDALIAYKQPVFVYIVPNGELRGGAWVVIDPSINPDMMEMYADTKSRAGVLEPEGIVEVKFRKPKLLATMERLDETYRQLKKSLADPSISDAKRQELELALEARERDLLPVYGQVALQFADLHDTPGRMRAKNTVRQVLEWRKARRFFYWRVHRRLQEEYAFKRMAEAKPTLKRSAMRRLLASWFAADSSDKQLDWEVADVEVVEWFWRMTGANGGVDKFSAHIERLCVEAIAESVVKMSQVSAGAVMEGVQRVFEGLGTDQRKVLLKKLASAMGKKPATTGISSGSSSRGT